PPADAGRPPVPGHHRGILLVRCAAVGTNRHGARELAGRQTERRQEYLREGLYDAISDILDRRPDIWFSEVPVQGDVATFVSHLYRGRENWRRLLSGRP